MLIGDINIRSKVYNYCFGNLVKEKKLATKNTLIDQKHYKNLMICFTRYVHKKSMKMLSLLYHELIGQIEEHEGKKYLMVDDYMLNKALEKIQNITSIEKLDETKILINTDNKLPDDVTLKNVLISMICIIRDVDKYYPQFFLEEALYVK